MVPREGTAGMLLGELEATRDSRLAQIRSKLMVMGVNLETRVVRDALKIVGEKKREAMIQIDEGRSVTGKRKKGMVKFNKR